MSAAPDGAGPADAGATMIADEVRHILAEVTGRPEMLGIAPEMPLFGQGVALDSLTGTLLLREIRRRCDVDVAGGRLTLDALETLGTLAAFVGEQVAGYGGAG